MDKKGIIGKRIKNLREQCNYKQSSIARYLNIDQSLVSKIENGERSITSDMLDKLATLFGVPVESITSENISDSIITLAFRACDISDDDLNTISDIQRIALNLEFMKKILGGNDVNG